MAVLDTAGPMKTQTVSPATGINPAAIYPIAPTNQEETFSSDLDTAVILTAVTTCGCQLPPHKHLKRQGYAFTALCGFVDRQDQFNAASAFSPLDH